MRRPKGVPWGGYSDRINGLGRARCVVASLMTANDRAIAPGRANPYRLMRPESFIRHNKQQNSHRRRIIVSMSRHFSLFIERDIFRSPKRFAARSIATLSPHYELSKNWLVDAEWNPVRRSSRPKVRGMRERQLMCARGKIVFREIDPSGLVVISRRWIDREYQSCITAAHWQPFQKWLSQHRIIISHIP